MEAERWQTIERLYHSALEREPSQRAPFLEQACGDDDSLRSEVESLLAQGEESGSFLETPALEVAAKALAQDRVRAVDGAGPTDHQMIGATIPYERAPGRIDHAQIPVALTTRTENFHGTARFELRRCLGAGGFGVVYEAYDREHDAIVALKTLQQLGAGAIYRFKREFRALADIAHPNLITLYELSADSEHWFFTMELVEGVDFLSYVSQTAQTAGFLPRPGMDRLRDALRQLAQGIRALHQAGKLHCDLKPSNVLIDRTGRVVILDFGLVTESDAIAPQDNNLLVGTAAYISPEQVRGLGPSAAGDWYSVGVMLFEALTGQQPFRGSVREIMEHKRRRDPPVPADLVSGLPPDLDTLCCRLLSRDPQRRPADEEVLRYLGGDRTGSGESSVALNSVSRSPFIGRERPLAVLREAFESTREGRPVTVWVHGRSGVGKTALVQRFLDEMRQRNDRVVLEGRCYERETVPYNALDSVVDNLDRYVRSLPRAEAQALMPPNLATLMRLFPVLQEWHALSDASPEVANASDLKELRRHGFAALRQMLDRVAMRQPLVLFIDDLQWGDEDSADLLADLIKGGSAALLLVACYRSEEADSSPLLRRLTPLRATDGGASSVVDMALEELDPPQAAELAAGLLEEAQSSVIAQAQSIAREAQGNPFFIGELVRYAQMREELQANPEEASKLAAGTQPGMTVHSLNDVIRARSSRLSAATRRLLEVVAVAGQPIDLHIAKRAARIGGGGHAEIHQLRAAHLIRTRKTEGPEQVEAYHDRIREVTESSLDPELLKQHHYRLAFEWEASTQAGPRVLAIHFRGAGIPDKAFHYAVEAAHQAETALAFGGAIEFYRFALEALPKMVPESPERDHGELELRQSLVEPSGHERDSAPETVDANKRIAALAEKSGNLTQLFTWVIARQVVVRESGDLAAAGALADQALELALREGSRSNLGMAHLLQIATCYQRGDLAGVERHFAAGLKFFDDPGIRQFPMAVIQPLVPQASTRACWAR